MLRGMNTAATIAECARKTEAECRTGLWRRAHATRAGVLKRPCPWRKGNIGRHREAAPDGTRAKTCRGGQKKACEGTDAKASFKASGGANFASVFRTQKRPQKCEPQQLGFTPLGPFFCVQKTDLKMRPLLWRAEGTALSSEATGDGAPQYKKWALPLLAPLPTACTNFSMHAQRL